MLVGSHEEDIDSAVKCLTDYLYFCVDTVVPARKVRCFGNKLWVTIEVKAILNKKSIQEQKL